MKKIVLLCTMFCAFATFSIAQTTDTKTASTEKMHKGKGKGKHHDHMENSLGLNADQKAKMKEIRNTYKGKFKAVRSDKSLSKEQRKMQMQDIQTAHDADMKGLLTAEQYTQFTAAKGKHKEDMKGKHKEKKAQKQ